MKITKKTCLLLCILGVASSCGAFKTKSKGAKVRQTDTNLGGVWTTGCTNSDWLGLVSQSETLKFSALGDFDRTTTLFSDGQCATPNLELTVRGTFDTLGDDAKVEGSDDINFTVTSASTTPRSENGATILNAVSYCEVSNWANGQTVDTLDNACAGSWHKGSVIFDIYRLDQDNKNLRFGRPSFFLDRGDAGSRPESLDETSALTKS